MELGAPSDPVRVRAFTGRGLFKRPSMPGQTASLWITVYVAGCNFFGRNKRATQGVALDVAQGFVFAAV